MLLGFISLLLTIGQAPISKICIPAKAGDIMLPCKKAYNVQKEDGDSRRLLSYQEKVVWHRILAGSTVDNCSRYEVSDFFLFRVIKLYYMFKFYHNFQFDFSLEWIKLHWIFTYTFLGKNR